MATNRFAPSWFLSRAPACRNRPRLCSAERSWFQWGSGQLR